MALSFEDNNDFDDDKQIIEANLDNMRQKMVRLLSASPSTCLQDTIMLESLPVAKKLFLEVLKHLYCGIYCSAS